MTRRRLVLALALVLCVGVVLLGYLFYRTRAVDIDAQNRVELDLRELQRLDAEWDLNILRSHLGLNPSYDPLTHPLVRMRALRAALAGMLPMTQRGNAAHAVAQMDRAFEDKEVLVEQFKSQNAILRNSLIFFPPAVTDFREHPDSAAAKGIKAALETLLVNILRYNLAPASDLGREIEASVERIGSAGARLTGTSGETLTELLRHAQVIVRYRKDENALEERIAEAGTVAAMGTVGRVFDQAFVEMLREKERLRGVLVGYASLLLVLLVVAAHRLRRSYRIIGSVNRRLQAANATLEARVAERTAALAEQSSRLEQLALYDSLTGLINYRELTRLLEHALLCCVRRNTTVALLFIDLDGFKAVNDTWGHATGDLVLQAVAQRVRACLRATDALARLGGDEFVILLEDVNACAGAQHVAGTVLRQIESITEAGGHPIRISASIGISAASGSAGAARGAAALLAEADQAMYQCKQAGKADQCVSACAQWGAPHEPGLRSAMSV